jgi:hypothetical protein
MAKLAVLNAWKLVLVLLALAAVAALSVWVLIWVVWTIRPLLTAAAALGAVVGVFVALRRHRARSGWHDEEWIGS